MFTTMSPVLSSNLVVNNFVHPELSSNVGSYIGRKVSSHYSSPGLRLCAGAARQYLCSPIVGRVIMPKAPSKCDDLLSIFLSVRCMHPLCVRNNKDLCVFSWRGFLAVLRAQRERSQSLGGVVRLLVVEAGMLWFGMFLFIENRITIRKTVTPTISFNAVFCSYDPPVALCIRRGVSRDVLQIRFNLVLNLPDLPPP